MIRAAAIAGLCVLSLAWASVRAEAPATRPAVLIGVWYQPASSFRLWHERGINTLIGYESEGDTVPIEQWKASARAAGLNYICRPSNNPAADAADEHLTAFLLAPDEPDGAGNKSPQQMQEAYKALKAAAPGKPILINFDGWKMKWRPEKDYVEYLKACDWAAVDVYVFNGGQLQTIDDYGHRIDESIRAGGKDKPIFAFIECSDQNLGAQDWAQKAHVDQQGHLTGADTGITVASRMRPPTPKEMRQEIDAVMAHGASGIMYFPDRIGKNWEAFDATTKDLDEALRQANADLNNATEKK